MLFAKTVLREEEHLTVARACHERVVGVVLYVEPLLGLHQRRQGEGGGAHELHRAVPAAKALRIPEVLRERRVLRIVRTMDDQGFGNCSNTYECEAVCPAKISASFIAKLNREYARAQFGVRLGE